MRSSSAVVVRILLALVMLSTVARADSDKDRAAKLFEQARMLVKEQKYEAACPLFESSYKLEPAIGTELNLGDCDEHIGKLEDAKQMFDSAAAHWAKTNDKRGKFARERADAVTKKLDELAAAAKSVETPDPPPPPLVTVGPETRRRRSRIYLAVGIGVVAIGAVIGAELYKQRADDATQAIFDGGDCTRIGDTLACDPKGAMQLDDANRQATISGALAIAGGVLAVTSVIVFLTTPKDAIAVAPVVGLHQLGLSISARF